MHEQLEQRANPQANSGALEAARYELDAEPVLPYLWEDYYSERVFPEAVMEAVRSRPAVCNGMDDRPI